MSRWNNGTVYGPDDLFYYTQGDKYTGQWMNNIQHGMLDSTVQW